MTKIPPHGLDPAGATDGQVPRYDAAAGRVIWADGSTTGGGLPAGGSTGQVLTKLSSTDGDADWQTPSGGGGGAETWEQAVTALTGKVHRWKFDEASAAAVDDAVGSLDLALSGGFTRNVDTLTGKGAQLDGSTGFAASSGLGSIPVGAADRTVIILFRSTSTDITTPETALFSYGGGGTRTFFELTTNVSSNRPNLIAQVGGVSVSMNFTLALDSTWHVAAMGSASARFTMLYLDSVIAENNQAGDLATPSSGNFYVGQRGLDSTRRAPIVVDDVIVCNKWVGKAALDRLCRALPAA